MGAEEIKDWLWDRMKRRQGQYGTMVGPQATLYLDRESWYNLRYLAKMGEVMEVSVEYDHATDRLRLFGQPVLMVLLRDDGDYIDVSWKQ